MKRDNNTQRAVITKKRAKIGRPERFSECALLKVYLERAELDQFAVWVKKHGYSGMSAVTRRLILDMIRGGENEE